MALHVFSPQVSGDDAASKYVRESLVIVPLHCVSIIRRHPYMTSALRGGRVGVSPKEDVVREVA